MLHTQLHHTTAYHPQSNGLMERFHRHLKSALRARLTGPNWMQELPWVLLGIRTAPKEDLGCSSAEIVYGAPLTVPGDFVPSCVHAHLDVPLHLRQLRDQVRGPHVSTWRSTCLCSPQPPVNAEPRRRRGRPNKHPRYITKEQPLVIPQPHCTRSGRPIKPPQRYISVLEGSGVADMSIRV
jgi:hypothetical protein